MRNGPCKEGGYCKRQHYEGNEDGQHEALKDTDRYLVLVTALGLFVWSVFAACPLSATAGYLWLKKKHNCKTNYLYIMDSKTHWGKVYATKTPDQLSWTQLIPQTSLDFIDAFQLPRTARIIDIGGGDSRLVDFLLDEGFQDITVLDISEESLQRARLRLGEKASLVRWIVSDITNFKPDIPYDLWHDRATFHFLTERPQVNRYLSIARETVHTGGYAVIGTFSNNGPEKCSGLPVHQYTEQELTEELVNGFEKLKCITEDHLTPFNTSQNFLFCSFRRA